MVDRGEAVDSEQHFEKGIFTIMEDGMKDKEESDLTSRKNQEKCYQDLASIFLLYM